MSLSMSVAPFYRWRVLPRVVVRTTSAHIEPYGRFVERGQRGSEIRLAAFSEVLSETTSRASFSHAKIKHYDV